MSHKNVPSIRRFSIFALAAYATSYQKSCLTIKRYTLVAHSSHFFQQLVSMYSKQNHNSREFLAKMRLYFACVNNNTLQHLNFAIRNDVSSIATEEKQFFFNSAYVKTISSCLILNSCIVRIEMHDWHRRSLIANLPSL